MEQHTTLVKRSQMPILASLAHAQMKERRVIPHYVPYLSVAVVWNQSPKKVNAVQVVDVL
jgi:hypothetical protein